MRKAVYAVCEQQTWGSVCSLISAFVGRWPDNIIPIIAKSGILRLASLRSCAHHIAQIQVAQRNHRNDPKFSDRFAWANSADPDQTAPRGAV